MRRERLLENFLDPKTVAVIGASDNPEKVGNILMKRLLRFEGKVIPINIKHDEVFGRKAYKSILNYSEHIDLAIIAIPAKFVNKELEICGEKKIKNIIVVSAGFSEVGNKESEKKLVEIAKRYGMNLLGPNCFGIVSPFVNLDATFAYSSAKKGNIAFISQSGALWSYVSDVSFSREDLGFSGFVSLGNMVDLNFSDFIEYFDRDENTKKIVLYIEKLKDGRRFIEVCKKSKKEIIVIKGGKTKIGGEATISHTGSLATDFEIYKGAFKQAGIKLVDSLSSALNFKKPNLEIPFDKKDKIKIITNAGGAGALISDYLVERGFEVEVPEDLIGTALAKDYESALERVKSKDYNLVVVFTPQSMSEPEATAKVIVDFRKRTKKNILAVFLGDNSVKKAKTILDENKINCITDI